MLFWKKGTPQSKKVLIIGPANAGKTTLLSALALASKSPDQYGAEIYNLNRPMLKLRDSLKSTLQASSQSPNATTAVTEYQFMLRAEISHFSTTIMEGDFRETVFSVVDGPGGALLPNPKADLGSEDIEFRELLLQKACEAESLVICLDATDKGRGETFFISLMKLLHELGEPLPFSQVAFFLTKAERVFLSARKQAAQKANETNPWGYAWEILTKPVVRELWAYCDPKITELACGWISAHGFHATQDGDDLRQFHPTWTPFNLFDPFVYLADGGTSTLWIHSDYRDAL